ncbi:MAG TPA: EfeM/EfeO family lipoprotein, partial [Mycobacteriales bacterium]|nr:EfeM/EfeO family lipoprotein [Mycobacteriales bacterium]
MALRWRIGRGRRLLRFGAVAGTSIALLLSAGGHGGGSSDRADGDGAGADADAVAEEPEGVEPESASPSGIRPVDPLVTAAVRSYEAYLQAQARALPARARGFTDAVRRGDVAAARKNFAASRVGWERIQSVGLQLPRLDRSIDARADDFATPSDRAWTGWHRLEQLLWTARGTAGATPYADRLDRDLQQLSRAVPGLVITAPIMTTGIQRLVEEAIAEK